MTLEEYLGNSRRAKDLFGIIILSYNVSVTPYFATFCLLLYIFFPYLFHICCSVFFFRIINKMIFLHKHFCLLIFLFFIFCFKKIHKFDKFNYEITFYIMRLYVGVGGEYIRILHDGLKISTRTECVQLLTSSLRKFFYLDSGRAFKYLHVVYVVYMYGCFYNHMLDKKAMENFKLLNIYNIRRLCWITVYIKLQKIYQKLLSYFMGSEVVSFKYFFPCCCSFYGLVLM